MNGSPNFNHGNAGERGSDSEAGFDFSGDERSPTPAPLLAQAAGRSTPAQNHPGIIAAQQRVAREQSMFATATCMCSLLFIAAVLFAAFALYHAVFSSERIDWHAWIFIAAMVVPPTVIMVALLRAIYPRAEAMTVVDHPTVQAGKEILAIGNESIAAIKSLLRS